jgi:hypothetical protein
MRRCAIALVLVAAMLTAGTVPADAGPRAKVGQRMHRLLRPAQRLRALHPRGGVLGAGWVNMLHAAAVARPGAHAVGLPRVLVELRAAPGTWGRQRKSQWCWAAASQMVLNYLGVLTSQEDVILRAYGGFLDRPASPEEIAYTLDGWRQQGPLGVHQVVRAVPYRALYTDTVVSDLAGGRPLIVGLRNPNNAGGHAYVLTAVTYDIDVIGHAVARTATFRDPWPDNPGIVELPWEEVNARFVGAVRIDVAAGL